MFAAPEPAAPVFPVAPASEAAPASATPAEVEQPVAAPAAAPEPSAQPQSTPAPSHFATPEPTAVEPQQDDDPADRVTEDLNLPDVSDAESGDDADTVSPGDTAEIDVAAVEAKLKDPGSTMSFEPLTDERIETDSTYDAGTTTQATYGGARSDVGCVRPHNEDSYLVQSPLFCVCDGMGGHAAGEVASSIAVETIAKTAPQSADAARLAAAVEAANAAVIEAALNGLGKPGMGCTATCAYIENDTLAIAHVGDSRAYLLHEGTLIRVTRDHSYVEELVDAGEITADEARVHPNRSVITRALGSDPAMYADHFTLHIEEGDRLILCSDGLSSMIPDSDIENIATQSSTAQICVDNLVDAALAAGGHDNVTVVVVGPGRRRRHARDKTRPTPQRYYRHHPGPRLCAGAGIWAYTRVSPAPITWEPTTAMSPSGAACPASHSDSSSTGSKAKPASSCPTCPKTRKTASRRAFRKQVSTMRRTRYPQVPPPDRRGADPPGDRRANDSRQHQSGIDLRIRFRENRRTVRRGRSLR